MTPDGTWRESDFCLFQRTSNQQTENNTHKLAGLSSNTSAISAHTHTHTHTSTKKKCRLAGWLEKKTEKIYQSQTNMKNERK